MSVKNKASRENIKPIGRWGWRWEKYVTDSSYFNTGRLQKTIRIPVFTQLSNISKETLLFLSNNSMTN